VQLCKEALEETHSANKELQKEEPLPHATSLTLPPKSKHTSRPQVENKNQMGRSLQNFSQGIKFQKSEPKKLTDWISEHQGIKLKYAKEKGIFEN